MSMPSALLDQFSAIFGERRGLPENLCRRRRAEDLRAGDYLVRALAGGTLPPGESLLIAGYEKFCQSAVCHQILARLIDRGDSCLMICSNELESASSLNQVVGLTASENPNIEDLLTTAAFPHDGASEKALTNLLGEFGAYDAVCVDTLDNLASVTDVTQEGTLARLKARAREWNTRLIVTKKTPRTSTLAWREQLRFSGLLEITDHVGAISRDNAATLKWDGGQRENEIESTILQVDPQTEALRL